MRTKYKNLAILSSLTVWTPATIKKIDVTANMDYDERIMKVSPFIKEGTLPEIECLGVAYPVTTSFESYEFSANCKLQKNPDYGTISIELAVDTLVPEMKSLKEYLHGYTNFDIYQEETLMNILYDVVKACNPIMCIVKGHFNPRGGTFTDAQITYKR